MKRIQFFATRDDILRVLETIECDERLQYVRTGNQLTETIEKFDRGSDITNLGVADRETGSVCKAFLVAKTTTTIAIERTTGASGVQRYLVDQLLNPDTVTFTPAGMWNEDVVLQGVVGTTSDSQASQDLMWKFNSAFKRFFTKVQGRFIGSQALKLFNEGKRLTIAVQSPPEFDLTHVHQS